MTDDPRAGADPAHDRTDTTVAPIRDDGRGGEGRGGDGRGSDGRGSDGRGVVHSDDDTRRAPDRSRLFPLLGIAAVAVGIVVGLVLRPEVPDGMQPYLPIAVVAALDAVFGGLRAYLEEIFDAKVFVVSFVFNVVVAGLIVWLGDQLGVGTQLSTAIVVVLGIRIFGNTSSIRRKLFGA